MVADRGKTGTRTAQIRRDALNIGARDGEGDRLDERSRKSRTPGVMRWN